MNTRANTFDKIRRLLLALASLTLLVSVEAAADKTNKAPTASVSATNAPAKVAPIEVPTSQFVIPTTVAEGRNPFFPDSLVALKAAASTSTNATTKAAPAMLDLKGISGTPTKRFALINNRTFEEGEEADVTVGAGRSKVHINCIRIREESVTVEADGVRMELKLRPGL